MADVIMEMGGKRKRVPAERVAYFEAKGAKRVDAEEAAEPANTVEANEPGEGFSLSDLNPVNAGKALIKQLVDNPLDPSKPLDAHALGAAKAATLGNADVGAGIGGALGQGWQAFKDDATPLEIIQSLGEGYTGARDEHRGLENKAWAEHPGAYGSGIGAGTAATGPLLGGPGSSAENLNQQVARGVAGGAAGGVGFGDSDSVVGDLLNAYVGATLGGVAPVMAGPVADAVGPLVKQGAGAVGDAASAALGKVRGLAADTAGGLAAKGKGVLPDKIVNAARAVSGGLERSRGDQFADEIAALEAADGSASPGRASVAPPAEVTSPGGVSPVPDLVDAAGGAGETPPSSPGRREILDAELEKAREMVRANAAGEPVPDVAPPTTQERAIVNQHRAQRDTASLRRQPPASVQPAPSPADDFAAQIAAVDEDPLAAMRSESAQDWGTRPPSRPQDFTGQPIAPDEVMPGPPAPELVDYFLQRGATREQALAQAHAVMAKMFAGGGPGGAVGRQRAAAPFSGQKPAPIATPRGRNRAAAPFRK